MVCACGRQACGMRAMRCRHLITAGALQSIGVAPQLHPPPRYVRAQRDEVARQVAATTKKAAGVVDMRVGQNDEIQTCGVKRKSLLIVLVGLAPPLGHAAIDQKAAAMGLNQKAGARDRLRGTVKSDVHEASIDDPHGPSMNLAPLAPAFPEPQVLP